MLVGMFNRIIICYRKGCGLEQAMFVFLVLLSVSVIVGPYATA